MIRLSEDDKALENFTAEITDVLVQCGRMPLYNVDLSYDTAINQICLKAEYEDKKPYRVLITIEEV